MFCTQREILDARGGLAEVVDANVAIGILGSVEGRDVGEGLGCVCWEVFHGCKELDNTVQAEAPSPGFSAHYSP